MRILLALALLLLAGCPSKQTLKGQPATPAKKPSPTMQALKTKLTRPFPLKQIKYDDFPAEAAAYLEASLNNLMSGGEYAPKDMTLAYMGLVPGCQIGRDAILREVEISGESLAPGLIAAYMAADPENCLRYIQRQVNAGQIGYLGAIGNDKDVGKWVFEHVHISPEIEGSGSFLLERIIGWELDPTPYLPHLRALVNSDDPVNSVRAAGYLVSEGLATLEEKQQIIDSLKDDEMMKFVGGIEAIKMMSDPDYAEELVPIIAEAEIGKLNPEADAEMKVAFAAYGLTSLRGEQAKLLRLRLLDSTNPLVRMEAAFGELMQGDPSHWKAFVASGHFKEEDIIASFRPVDAWHIDLLPFYLDLIKSDITHNRIVAADHMARYKEYSDNETVKQILRKLFDDPDGVVREHAWFTATSFSDGSFLDEALAVLQDEDEIPKVRLIATLCAMQPTINRINGRN